MRSVGGGVGRLKEEEKKCGAKRREKKRRDVVGGKAEVCVLWCGVDGVWPCRHDDKKNNAELWPIRSRSLSTNGDVWANYWCTTIFLYVLVLSTTSSPILTLLK